MPIKPVVVYSGEEDAKRYAAAQGCPHFFCVDIT